MKNEEENQFEKNNDSTNPFDWMKDYFTKEMIIFLIVAIICVIYIIICLMAFAFKCLLNSCAPHPKKYDSKKYKRILIVIAHPDDECMFFGPTIMNLIQISKRNLFILCLSNGNYEGLGKIRKQELWLSCSTMGVFSSNITLLQYDKLKDDPNMDWPTNLISRAILDHVHSYDIDTLITFDGKGVSGHKNHVAISKAVNALIAQNQWPHFCQVFTLESVNIFRMYIASFLDLAFSYLTSHSVYFVDIFQRASIVGAMQCHTSQLVWFRRLYLLFSRYILINTLKQIHAAQPRAPLPVKDKEE